MAAMAAMADLRGQGVTDHYIHGNCFIDRFIAWFLSARGKGRPQFFPVAVAMIHSLKATTASSFARSVFTTKV
ncbi:hypothetical protein BH10PSE18_BH10PSE18_02720 [soil metagenome]